MAEAYFILSSDRDRHDSARLLSYSGVTKAGKLVLTLKVEVSGFDVSHALESLEAIQRVNDAKPAPPKAPSVAKKKAIGQTKVLASPAPNKGQL
jgi:hypothetical protein